MGKKILFITTSFEQKANSAAIRNNALVKGLMEIGHDITVLTPTWPEHLLSHYFISNRNCKIIRIEIPRLNKLKVIHSIKIKKGDKLFSKIKKFIRELIFFPDLCKGWEKSININDYKDFDLIISSSDLKSSHYVGEKLKYAFPKKTWIQIWGDPWYFDKGINYISKMRAKKREKELLNKADKIIYTSEITKKIISNCNPILKNKIYYIPRSYYTEVRKNLSFKHDYYRIIYTGVLSQERTFEFFLEAIDIYNLHSNKKKIKVEFYGNYLPSVSQKIESFRCAKAYNSVDFEEILKLYSESDGLLFISNHHSSTQIPGKIFDYMGTELPVICLVNNYEDDLFKMLVSLSKCIVIKNDKTEILNKMPLIIEKMKNIDPININFSPTSIAQEILKEL